MAEGITLDEHGLALVERDAGWRAEVRREVLQAVLDVEFRSIAANLMSWFIAAMAALALPNTALFVLPLAGRLVTLFGARLAFARLRARMAARADHHRELRWLGLALFIAGASCAPVLTPILLDPFIHPARMVLGGTVIVGVTLAYSLLSPIPRLAAAYISGFVATFAAIMLTAKYWAAVPTILALCAILSIVGLYGLAKSMRNRHAAEMLVDNRRLSEELSDALAHAEFLALRDPLTGLFNRRAFFQRATEAPARTRHVLTIDLDHFKAINDRHGHATGDNVLIGVGQALRAVVGELDAGDHYPARIGGEEFAMVLDVANPELAGQVAEMVRLAIAILGADPALPALTTSASIGLCLWGPGQPIDDALSRADAALFQAKARGRNRVMAAAA